jgi:glycosyltransferase involved in cell wall biosynthesis
MLVSIVIPFHNEAENLPLLIRELDVQRQRLACEVEYVAVDDGSNDGGADVLDAMKLPYLSVVRLRRRFGKSQALEVGFQEARGDVIVTMDADLQDNPENLADLLEAIDRGYDVVSGWKKERKDPLNRRFSSFLYNKMVAVVVGRTFRDINSGYKAYRRWVLRDLRAYGENHRILLLNASLNGARILEVPVSHRPRLHGSSKYHWNRFFSAFMDFWWLLLSARFFFKPLHFFGLVGFAPFVTGLGLLVGVWAHHLLRGKPVDLQVLVNPLTFLASLLILGGLQIISIGLIAEYALALKFRERFFELDRRSALVRSISTGGLPREESDGRRDPA